jgi:hypothetical protein
VDQTEARGPAVDYSMTVIGACFLIYITPSSLMMIRHQSPYFQLFLEHNMYEPTLVLFLN